MSTRFFASVRRNQKQWMVVVTVLSMVSFLFLDDFGRGKGPLSPFGGALIIGSLCAAGMCIIGYPRQKTTEFGVGGFAVGFLAGFVGFGAVGGNKPLVRTAIGNFTRNDFEQLARQRQKINQFISAVSRKTRTNPQGFGGTDEQSLVSHQMMIADAKKMGIRVSDERVNAYLKQLSQGRLTKDDFRDCLHEARVGEGELFDLLKQELSARMTIELTEPPAFVPPIMPGFQQYIQESPRYMQQTPYQLWSAFQKLTVKQSLQAVAIPVRDFTSQVGEPSELELASFFEKYKTKRWVDESQPGFVRLPRVQLAYLSADFEKFEKGTDPTDQEVRDYYEENKERYRAPLAKESTAPKLPSGEGDQQKPENSGDELKKSDDGAKPNAVDPKADAAPAEKDKKPAVEPIKIEEKKEPAAAEKPKADPKSSCGDEPSEKTDKPKADIPKAEPATPVAPEVKSGEGAPQKTSEPADSSDPSVPKLSSSPESLPAAKFRELDDELKLEIREEILRERAFLQITAEIDKGHEFMVNLGLEFDSTVDADKKKESERKKEKGKAIAEQLKKYAADHNLEYSETPVLTYEEFASEPIGLAFEFKGRSPVMNDIFTPGPRGEPRIPLYSPRRADLKSQTGSFAYWKIAESPAQIADLKDETVRAKVLTGWKFDQARSFAEKRAAELAKKAKAEGNDLPAALSGESVTGNKSDPAITVIPTDPFTWLTTNQSIPNAPRDPRPSSIPLIEHVDEGFMKTVFEQLSDGEIGVVPDGIRSTFYVVKVLNRETASNDDGGVAKQERQQKFMKEEFASKFFPLMKSPYQALAQNPQLQIDSAWRKAFDQNHRVDWERDLKDVESQK